MKIRKKTMLVRTLAIMKMKQRIAMSIRKKENVA